MESIDPHLHKLFTQAYILGGSPCSGKSTIAQRLVSQLDLPYYKVDDHEQAHLSLVQPGRHPVMHRFLQMTWEQIWMRPPERQMQEELDFYRERFEMILQDLRQYTLDRPVLMEGAAFLPELVYHCGARAPRVIVMVPTREFQWRHYSQRPWIQHILTECRDPAQAFENWMQRDQLFSQEVVRQAAGFGYPTLLVDGSQGIEDHLEQVRISLGI